MRERYGGGSDDTLSPRSLRLPPAALSQRARPCRPAAAADEDLNHPYLHYPTSSEDSIESHECRGSSEAATDASAAAAAATATAGHAHACLRPCPILRAAREDRPIKTFVLPHPRHEPWGRPILMQPARTPATAPSSAACNPLVMIPSHACSAGNHACSAGNLPDTYDGRCCLGCIRAVSWH